MNILSIDDLEHLRELDKDIVVRCARRKAALEQVRAGEDSGQGEGHLA